MFFFGGEIDAPWAKMPFWMAAPPTTISYEGTTGCQCHHMGVSSKHRHQAYPLVFKWAFLGGLQSGDRQIISNVISHMVQRLCKVGWTDRSDRLTHQLCPHFGGCVSVLFLGVDSLCPGRIPMSSWRWVTYRGGRLRSPIAGGRDEKFEQNTLW